MSQYLQSVFTSLRNEMVFGVELKSPHSGIQVTSREASMRVTLTVMTPMLVSPQVAQDFSCRLWLWRGTTPSVYSQAMLHTGSDSTTVQIIEVVYEELVGWIVEEFSFRSTCFGGSRNEIYKQWLWSYKHITEWCVLHIFFTHHSLEHLNKNKCTVCVTTYSVNSVYMTDLVNITKAFQQIWYLFDMWGDEFGQAATTGLLNFLPLRRKIKTLKYCVEAVSNDVKM